MNDNATDANRACGDICSGENDSMRLTLTDQIYRTNTSRQYEYCDSNDNAFTKNLAACSQCLQNVPSAKALVRYLEVMNEACVQQPRINGTTSVKMSTPLFEGITNDTSQSGSTATSSPSAAVSSSAASGASDGKSDSNLRLGLGLGLGLGIPLLLISAGAAFLLLRQRTGPSKEKDASKVEEAQYKPIDQPLPPMAGPAQGQTYAELGVANQRAAEMSGDERLEKDSKAIVGAHSP